MKNVSLFLILTVLFFFPGCGISAPSQEELKEVSNLESDLKFVQEEIKGATEKKSGYSGGLIFAMVEARIEILKITEALLFQRIQAIKSGAKIKIEVSQALPNLQEAESVEKEIKEQEQKLFSAKSELSRYSGGLILALKGTEVATIEQTIALLRQKSLCAKFGLLLPTLKTEAVPQIPSIPARDESAKLPDEMQKTDANNPKSSSSLFEVKLLKKDFSKQNYQEFVFFDIEFSPNGLKKPTRAIKGVLLIQDIFGEPKFRLNLTINQVIVPGKKIVEKGTGFNYNQFISEHQWVMGTELKDLTASFVVTNILYQDGEKEDIQL